MNTVLKWNSNQEKYILQYKKQDYCIRKILETKKIVHG